MARIKIAGLNAPKSFIARFRGSDVSAEIEDENVNVEITVPGLQGNKGNSILRCSLTNKDDMLSEIEAQMLQARETTPAECVRRSAAWEGEGEDRAFTFRTSELPGSRTHRIPETDVDTFLAALASRFDAVEKQVESLTEVVEGE